MNFQSNEDLNCMFACTESIFSIINKFDINYKFKFSHSSSKSKDKHKLKIKIPDTVIYKSGIPISWYYQENDKLIKKTNYKDISIKDIISKCISNKDKNEVTDIIGMYLSEEKKDFEYAINPFNNEKKLVKTSQKVSVEYCLEDSINYYLKLKKKTNNLFQAFHYTGTKSHNLYEVYWNNHSVVVSKYKNLHYMSDKSKSEEEKLFTVEDNASHFVSSNNMTNSRICQKFRIICNDIKNMIDCVYFYRDQTERYKEFKFDKRNEVIKSFKFYAKIDNEFNVYILFFSNANFFNNSKIFNDSKLIVSFCLPTQQVKYKVDKKEALEFGLTNNVELKNRVLCKGCEAYVNSNCIHKIPYSIIIKNHDLKLRDKTSSKNQLPKINTLSSKNSIFESLENEDIDTYGVIPHLITKLEKGIKISLYLKIKNYPDFLSTIQEVCTDCYLYSTSL